MIKSPLRYPGGKSRGIGFLQQFVPEYKDCREVFFGGGSFSFHQVQVFPERRFLASDLNFELYCFWQELKTNAEELIAEIQVVYNRSKKENDGRSLFQEILSRRMNQLTKRQRAIDFFILNRITFSGVVDSGGYSQGSFDGRFTQSAIDRLKNASKVIQKIDFYCDDFLKLIQEKGDEVLLFLDPPYYSATKSKLYGKNGLLHIQFNHQKLFDSLQNSPHLWLMTYDNSEFIQELYKDFYQIPWSLQYGMTNSTSAKGNELLIANYDIKKMIP